MSVRLYPGFTTLGRFRVYYVRTGEFRCPKEGEFFLSGAVPEVYMARTELATKYHIMRKATWDETHCPTCGAQREVTR